MPQNLKNRYIKAEHFLPPQKSVPRKNLMRFKISEVNAALPYFAVW